MDRDSKIQARRLFQRVLLSDEGRLVLANILVNLGYFETDPKQINPDYIAFANRLLNQVGINNLDNLSNIMDRLAETATEEDITEDNNVI